MARREPTSMRTCAGTRRREARDGLVRWMLGPDGTPWPDWTGRSARLNGRGAWTLADAKAVSRAMERGGFARAFRGRVGRVDSVQLVERLAVAGRKAFFERLALGNRAGAVAIGQNAVRERFAMSDGGVLLVADDAGSSARSRYVTNARRKSVPTIRVSSGAVLGAPLGREFVSVALVDDGPFAEDLRRWARSLVSLPNTCIVEYDTAPAVHEAAEATVVETETR